MNLSLLRSLLVIFLINQPTESQLIPEVGEIEMCKSLQCLDYYIRYCYKIFLNKKIIDWSYWDGYHFANALVYFPVTEAIPVHTIEKALQVCINLGYKTRDECENFLDRFIEEEYTINVVAEFCAQHIEICLEPSSLMFTYQEHLTFKNAELNIYECVPFVVDRDNLLIEDNFQFAKILSRPRHFRLVNKCDCFQVHELFNASRLIKAQLERNKPDEGFVPETLTKMNNWYREAMEYMLIYMCAVHYYPDQMYRKPLFNREDARRISSQIANLVHLLTDPLSLLAWILGNKNPHINLRTIEIDDLVIFYANHYQLTI